MKYELDKLLREVREEQADIMCWQKTNVITIYNEIKLTGQNPDHLL